VLDACYRREPAPDLLALFVRLFVAGGSPAIRPFFGSIWYRSHLVRWISLWVTDSILPA
jgi:hypothetical protein